MEENVIANELKHIKITVDEIKVQTTTTNGRVSKLEQEQAFTRGVVALASAAIPIITALVTAIVMQVILR